MKDGWIDNYLDDEVRGKGKKTITSYRRLKIPSST